MDESENDGKDRPSESEHQEDESERGKNVTEKEENDWSAELKKMTSGRFEAYNEYLVVGRLGWAPDRGSGLSGMPSKLEYEAKMSRFSSPNTDKP
jgi:hypothetical protein